MAETHPWEEEKTGRSIDQLLLAPALAGDQTGDLQYNTQCPEPQSSRQRHFLNMGKVNTEAIWACSVYVLKNTFEGRNHRSKAYSFLLCSIIQ